MWFYILLCIQLQYALSSSNTTNNENLSETIEFLESLTQENVPDKNVVQAPVYTPDLLSVIHNFKSDLLIGQSDPTVTDHSLLLQSREIDKTDVNQENEHRRFLDWVKKLLIKERHPFKKLNLTTTPRPRKVSVTKTRNKKKNRAEVEEETESTVVARRFMNWFRDLFVGATTTTELPTTTPLDFDEKNKLTMQKYDTNLITVLLKLNNALERLNENLHVQNMNANKTDGFYVLKMPVTANARQELYRQKRDANMTSTESKEDAQYTIDTDVNNATDLPSTRRSNSANFLVQMRPNYEKIHENIYEHNKVQGSSQQFKTKLIDHLIVAFKEIKQKLSPLNEVKERYSADDTYRVGYILANIDILEINLDKLIAELEVRKLVYDENKLLELFDKLKTSSDVIGNLIVSLKKYIKN